MGARQPGKLGQSALDRGTCKGRGLACIRHEETEEIQQRYEREEQGAGEQGGREGDEVREAGRACCVGLGFAFYSSSCKKPLVILSKGVIQSDGL